jgi:hypothetical protein
MSGRRAAFGVWVVSRKGFGGKAGHIVVELWIRTLERAR